LKGNSIKVGVCYYPEHWPEERHETDIRLMAEAGIQLVRMGDYAWSRLEPEEGVYRFEWMESIIDRFGEHGIKTILCTPTSAPPIWLFTKHPDITQVDYDGHRMSAVTRDVCCHNNPIYQRYCEGIVRKLVKRFKDNKNVIAYQIDNELTSFPCCCEYCEGAYRNWIKHKYGTPADYNNRCGLVFWSQEIPDWDVVTIPRKTKKARNPSQLLDFKRFCSDTVVNHCRRQAEIIKEISPDTIVTTNLCGLLNQNMFDLSISLDLVSLDIYPRADAEVTNASYQLDFVRSLKRKNFWMLEQQCSPTAFREYNLTMEPGETRVYTYKSIAHGADAVVYFRWRACRFGAEQIGAGLLRHDGLKNRTYDEVQRICRELGGIEEYLHGSEPERARVAIVLSVDSCWSLQADLRITKMLDYRDELLKYYRSFEKKNIVVDFVEPGGDLSGYILVVAPMMTVIAEKDVNWLESFVEEGGTAVIGCLSGLFDQYGVITDNYYQGPLRKLLGIKVTEWNPFPKDEYGCFTWAGKKYWAGLLVMAVEREGAEAMAVYDTDYYRGFPAVTVNKYGRGEAYYVSTSASQDFYDDFFAKIMEKIDPACNDIYGDGLEIRARVRGDRKVYFVINHTGQPRTLSITNMYLNLLNGDLVQGETIVPASEVIVLTPEPGA